MIFLHFVLLFAGLLRGVWCLPGQLSPTCVQKCWENSRYVSKCPNETDCLCKDGIFQSAVLQCLYSQCQTAQFGSALHHALSKCSSLEKGISDISPPLLREQGLRKRNKRTVEDTSDPGSAPAIGSVARQSASASATSKRPTRSVASADLKKRVAQPTRSVATLDMEKRDSLPTRSLATLALENRHLDPARSVATLALERRNATPADATPTGATPAKATPAKATPAEATPTEATPAGATPLEATLTSASSLTSSATSPPKPTRSALQRRNHAHLPRAAKSQAARR